MREPQSPADAGLNALLGPGSVVEGKLSFKGQVRIEGTFTGEITTTEARTPTKDARRSGAQPSRDDDPSEGARSGETVGERHAASGVAASADGDRDGDRTDPRAKRVPQDVAELHRRGGGALATS